MNRNKYMGEKDPHATRTVGVLFGSVYTLAVLSSRSKELTLPDGYTLGGKRVFALHD